MKEYNMVIIIGTMMLLSISTHAEDFVSLDSAPADSEVVAIAPVFDFDGDGCLPSSFISGMGQQNPGLRPSGSLGGQCRHAAFLEYSNTLHRKKCRTKNGDTFCGHFFALYFKKDQWLPGLAVKYSHRHDWEQAAVWTINGAVTHGSVSSHGGMTTKTVSQIPRNGKHIKVVYHKDGIRTHAMRFAGANESAENSYGAFVTPPITSWMHLTGVIFNNTKMRSLLNFFDYGAATIPLKDSNFVSNLNRFKPPSYPRFYGNESCYFTEWFSEEGDGKAICSAGHAVKGIECSGDYCDNKRLKCCSIPGVEPSGSRWEGIRFSEEQPNQSGAFETSQVIVGVKCSGRYCDNLNLIFQQQEGENAVWTPSYSEERGLGECSKSAYVAGLKCSGRYCDNLSLRCLTPK